MTKTPYTFTGLAAAPPADASGWVSDFVGRLERQLKLAENSR